MVSRSVLALDALLEIVTSLSVDQSGGVERLYKPAVIAAVLGGIGQSELTENRISFDWVAPRALQKLAASGVEASEQQIAYAFYHLTSDHFWMLAFKDLYWDLENGALRHHLMVLRRQSGRPRLKDRDRLVWMCLRRRWHGWHRALVVVQPATVVKWHRKGCSAPIGVARCSATQRPR